MHSFIIPHYSRDIRRNRSSIVNSIATHTRPVGLPLGAAIEDVKETVTNPLSVRFTAAPVVDREISDVTTNLLNAFRVDDTVIQSSKITQVTNNKKTRAVSAPASRPSMLGSTGYRENPPSLRGSKTPTPVILEGRSEEGFDPGYAITPVNMQSNTRFASSSENSSLRTTSNQCSASTSGTNSPIESDSMNISKSSRAYVTSTSIGNALKNLNLSNQDQSNNTIISENTRKLQNLIPKCLSAGNLSLPNQGKKSVTTRYPDYSNSGLNTTPMASKAGDPRSTPEAEKSFSHVFSPRKGLNIPLPRSHVLVGGGGKK